MAESVAVVARELGRVWADELVAHERGQAGGHLRLVGVEGLHGAAVEDLALDGAAFEHPALRLLELVESGGQQRPQCRRHLDVCAPRGHREHLQDEQRVAARSAGDSRPELPRHGDADQRARLLRLERLQPHRPRPAGTPFQQLRSGHAQEEKRNPGGEQHRRLDQVEERLLAPLDVVQDDDQRRALLEQLPERPGDLVPARARIRLPQQRAQRRRRDRIRWQHPELLHNLHDRPMGNALPVRQATPSYAARLDRVQHLGDQPRLAHAGVPHHRHEVAARLCARALPRLDDPRELLLAADEPRCVTAFGRAQNGEEPVRRRRLRLPLQPQRFDRLRRHGRLDERVRRLSDQHLPRRRCLLEARGHVHRVTRRQPLGRPRHHLSGVHADAASDSQLR